MLLAETGISDGGWAAIIGGALVNIGLGIKVLVDRWNDRQDKKQAANQATTDREQARLDKAQSDEATRKMKELELGVEQLKKDHSSCQENYEELKHKLEECEEKHEEAERRHQKSEEDRQRIWHELEMLKAAGKKKLGPGDSGKLR